MTTLRSMLETPQTQSFDLKFCTKPLIYICHTPKKVGKNKFNYKEFSSLFLTLMEAGGGVLHHPSNFSHVLQKK